MIYLSIMFGGILTQEVVAANLSAESFVPTKFAKLVVDIKAAENEQEVRWREWEAVGNARAESGCRELLWDVKVFAKKIYKACCCCY